MIKHLFKLMWNRKRQNSLLTIEILISFIVIFSIVTMSVYYATNYARPLGFEYKRVWVIKYSHESTNNQDSLRLLQTILKNRLKSMSEIEAVTFCGNNFPFSIDRNRSGINYGGRIPEVNRYVADEDYAQVLNTRPIEGRWFTPVDAGGSIRSVVISRRLRERMFGTEQAIGKTFYGDNEDKIKLRIVGVIPDIKDQGNFQSEGYSLYQYVDGLAARSGYMLVKIAREADPTVEAKLFKMVSGTLQNSTVEINHLEDMRTTANATTLIPVIVLLILAAFLLVNVALGLFGVLWQNIATRRAEIGLRRSIGAPAKKIYSQIISETAILVTLAVVPGGIIISQLALFNFINITPAIYLNSFLISACVIYALVLVCALYPATIAARISPSEALHED